MNKHIFAVIALVGLVISFWPERLALPTPPPKGPVGQTLLNATSTDKSRVSAYYSSLADVIERDPAAVKTVGQFGTLHGKSLDLAFKGTDLPGKYLGLDRAIDGVLTAAVGREDIPLTPEKVTLLVQALKEVANDAR